MCLILFAYDTHPDYSLIFAGNRDEVYERPSANASWWDDAPHVLGGRDLRSGGTWLGITRAGRWATVTNVREPQSADPEAPSRGHLASDYLKEEPPPTTYRDAVVTQSAAYNGFNLFVGTPDEIHYVSNRYESPRRIEPGIHGLSNGDLNESWPKVERGKERLRQVVNSAVRVEPLFDLLEDRAKAPDDELPDTGVDRKTERLLSSPFIVSDEYGTRASTVLLIDREGTVTFVERTFHRGTRLETRRFSFEIERPSDRKQPD